MEPLVAEISCSLQTGNARSVRPTASPLSHSPIHSLPATSRQASPSTALLNADKKKSAALPIFPLPPLRPLLPSSLKFLWFGGDDSSNSRNDGFSAPADIEFEGGDTNSTRDQMCARFTAAAEPVSHASNVLLKDSDSNIRVGSDLALDQRIAKEVDFSTQEKPPGTAETPRSAYESSWIARLLQLRLSLWKAADSDPLKDCEDLLLSATSDDEKEHHQLSMNCSQNYSKCDNNASEVRNAASDTRYNHTDKETDRNNCLCMLEARERLGHNRESLSRFIHEVPVQEVATISKMCLLSNLAYIIPELQSKDLLKEHRLTFVTSSLKKKEQAEARASSLRAAEQVAEHKTGSIRQQELEVSNQQNRSRSYENASNKAAFGKTHASCPCEWFICDDEASNTRYLVIQGSESLASWRTNLAFDPTKFEGIAGVVVHRGVYVAAQGLYELVAGELVEHVRKGSRARLRFTGHSLGGSLATLVAMMLVKRGAVQASDVDVVVTLGAPCVLCAGEHLLRQLCLQDQQFVNVVMHRDIVPRAFACDYPLNAVRLLQRLHATFRHHPCLHFQKVLYAPIGQMMILQPSKMQSPSHPMLPSQAGLYLIKHPQHQYQGLDAFLKVREAQRAFLNIPHPLDVLKDFGAYGFQGAISRDHDPRSYRQAINTILALGLRQQLHAPISRYWPCPSFLNYASSFAKLKLHRHFPSQHTQVSFLLILSTSSQLLSFFISWA